MPVYAAHLCGKKVALAREHLADFVNGPAQLDARVQVQNISQLLHGLHHERQLPGVVRQRPHVCRISLEGVPGRVRRGGRGVKRKGEM